MSHLPDLRSVVAGAVAAAAVAALAFQPTPSVADPSGKPVSELLRDLQVLYRKSETASEAYNATAVKLTRQRNRANDEETALSSARSVLAEGRREAGRLARQQYRRGDVGLPPLVQVLLTRDPRSAMDSLHVIQRSAGRQALTVKRLVAGERRQNQLATRARAALAKQQKLTTRHKKQRDAVRSKLHDVQRMLASLSGSQLNRIRTLETAQQASAQRRLTSSSKLGKAKGHRKPSASGARALRYALKQIGKPYRFGAEGPGAYDCSGLTSRAWRKAGRSIPRTSQAQWKTLRHVSMKRLRPGDLVVYYRSASHVGMYAGGGKIVHAPRPGTDVKLAPVGAIPAVQGAVRPDAGARPLRIFPLPDLLR